MNRAGDLAGHCVYIGQICVAGIALRRTDGDEDDLRLLRGMAKVGSELDLSAGPVSTEQLGEKLLVNRHHTLVKLIHLIFVVVDT